MIIVRNAAKRDKRDRRGKREKQGETMNPNEKKKFTDQFRNPNGSYHIPTWLIVVLFICGGWPIAV